MSKGVSTLIASVLLIAFTVSIAMIYMGWTTGFVRTSTENVTGIAQTAVGCSSGIIELSRVYISNVTHNASINVINTGQISLDVNAVIINTTGGVCSTSSASPVAVGSSATLEITSGDCYAWNSSTFSSSVVTTSCSGVTDSTSSASDVLWM